MAEKKVAFLGIGSMGAPMARNLLKSGYSVTVFNRSRDRAEKLIADGAVVSDTPAGAVTQGGMVVTMLSNDAALEAVTLGSGGILEKLGKGGVHVSMSTVSPETSRKLASKHAEIGATFVAAPVFGRPDAAAAQKLYICFSGDAEAKERARPVFSVLGQSATDFGNDHGAANVVKLSGNFMILSAVQAMSEALALAEKNGIDRSTLINFFTQANFACPVYQNYGRILADRSYEPAGFKLELGMKDIRLARDTAEAAMVPMPLADLLHARLLESIAKGRAGMDWTAIELATAEDAALR